MPVEDFLFSAGGKFLLGAVVGYAIKKVMKIAAVVIGLFVAALAYLSYRGWVDVKWVAIEDASRSTLTNVQKRSLAASVTGAFVDKPRVFGTATDSDIVKTFPEKNILTMDGGIIAGMNGLIIGIAKLRGMQGTCLLGETSGYVVDAKASKSILESLLSIVQIMVDMTNLETKAKDTERLIQTMKQQVAGRALEGQQPSVPHKPDIGYIS